jgi:hypothetical protein
MRSTADTRRRRSSRARMPSSAGYLIAAVIIALGLFFALWWMLVTGGDEAPWLPAGLAASVVLLVALSAREVVMRRAWTRYLLESGISERQTHQMPRGHSHRSIHSSSLQSAALRAIQKQSADADSSGSAPEVHLEIFHLCQDYLANTDEALRSGLPSEKSIALRSGQERIRKLQKHHLLTWARDSTRLLTREAQQRARTSDKIETANRALDCLDSALKAYPDEPELHESTVAIREFIASVKVAHWVELAERSAFKGHYRRAIDRYKDALFYLDRETVKEEIRLAGEERIRREIEALRAKLKSSNKQPDEPKRNGGGQV